MVLSIFGPIYIVNIGDGRYRMIEIHELNNLMMRDETSWEDHDVMTHGCRDWPMAFDVFSRGRQDLWPKSAGSVVSKRSQGRTHKLHWWLFVVQAENILWIFRELINRSV